MHFHVDAFGDFEGEPVAGNAGLHENGRDRGGKTRIFQLHRRDVDADDSHLVIGQYLFADGLDGPQAQFHDRAGALGNRNENTGCNRVPVQQAKPHQRFDPRGLIGRDVENRLVDEGNEIFRDGDFQEGGNVLRLVAGLRIIGIEQLHAVATVALGNIERAVGFIDDLFQLAVRIGAGEGRTDADSDDEGTVPALVMGERQVFNGVADRLGKFANLLLGLERRQHDEFLTAIAAD
ncbi:hypothetical protein D3C78_1325810 [compost metagenome]